MSLRDDIHRILNAHLSVQTETIEGRQCLFVGGIPAAAAAVAEHLGEAPTARPAKRRRQRRAWA